MAGCGDAKVINVFYSGADGSDWAKYISDVLSPTRGLKVTKVEVSSSGSVSQQVVTQTSAAAVILASPKLFRSLLENEPSSTTLDQVVAGYCKQSSGSTGRDPIVLFMCGTQPDDLAEVDSRGRTLKDRLPCIDHWTLLAHDQTDRLRSTVCDLLRRLTARTSRPKMDFKLVPEEVKCEEESMVVLSFDESVAEKESELKMYVEVTGGAADDEQSAPVKVPVTWLNSRTVYFKAPPRRAGSATVRVFFKGHSIGSRSINYHASSAEVTVGIAQILLHQMSRLCDLLLVRRQNVGVEDVDGALSAIFNDDPVANEIPAIAFEKFMESYRFIVTNDDKSSLELPTAIHFAAKYGLSELASRLLDLPDALSAYGITNANGLYPEGLARAGKHLELAKVLENFREVGDGFNEIYSKMCAAYVNATESKSRKSPKKMSPNPQETIGGDYVAMKQGKPPRPAKKQSNTEEQELYLCMDGRQTNKPSIQTDDDDGEGSSSSSYEEVPPEPGPKGQAPATSAPAPTGQKPLRKPAPPPEKPTVGSSDRPKEPDVSMPVQAIGSQQELLNILDLVKHNQMTIAQAEILFREWQMRFQSGKTPSFKQKQEQLEQMRMEVQQMNQPSVIGSFMRAFRHGGKGTKTGEIPKAIVKSTSDVGANPPPTALKNAQRKLLLSIPDSPRSSLTSCSSRDSLSSRASTSSGVDMDMPATSNLEKVEEELHSTEVPPTPPIPPRSVPRDNTYGGNYLALQPEEDEMDAEYVAVRDKEPSPRPSLPSQKSMPEVSKPPVMSPRKLSSPEVTVQAVRLPSKAAAPTPGAKPWVQAPAPRGQSPAGRGVARPK